ncbi:MULTISPECIES: hypothetical protein [unclassified Bradyrhizobium]
MGKVKELDPRRLKALISWARTHASWLAGRSYIDEADLMAARMEARWGAGRLRLLVSNDLRQRFDRQRFLFIAATLHGDLDAVRKEALRMVTAWQALDRAATEAGKAEISALVWEVTLADGTVAAIVPDDDHAHSVIAEGRAVAVYTLDEIGRLLSAYPDIAKAKLVFPGAEVIKVNKSLSDPLDAIHDPTSLNDPL